MPLQAGSHGVRWGRRDPSQLIDAPIYYSTAVAAAVGIPVFACAYVYYDVPYFNASQHPTTQSSVFAVRNVCFHCSFRS